MATFVVLMLIGIVARSLGDVSVINPRRLYEKSLKLSEWEFKRDAIYYAGQCFDHNKALVNRKANLGQAMSGLLLLETMLLVLWISRVVG